MTAALVPYINLNNAIGRGGLGKFQQSQFIEVTFENLSGVQFDATAHSTCTRAANLAPTIAPIDQISMLPGEVLRVPVVATDVDGDRVDLSIDSSVRIPSSTLTADHNLVLRPSLTDVGSYTFDVIASDGKLNSRTQVVVNVLPDAVATTRVSGQVLDVDQMPLAAMQIELAGIVTMTNAEGHFVIDAGSRPLVSNTIRVRGDLFGDGTTYPFIAEKVPFLLGRDVSTGVINQIDRPIYLPKLNPGTPIVPTQDMIVSTPFVEGASLAVKAGTLVTRQGTPFTGSLSITEVPPAFTPASLPDWMAPDLVVTIQPGEMQFTTPTPITLPNRAGWAAGTPMELWSIDPVTGEFTKVGSGRVSANGEVFETLEGGIRTSSWHVVIPPPPVPIPPSSTGEPQDPGKTLNPKTTCRAEPTTCGADFLSRHIYRCAKESHSLVPYNSQGENRAVTLVYDSLRADPRPIIHGGINEAAANAEILTRIEIAKDNFTYQVPGYIPTETPSLSQAFSDLQGGEHFFKVSDQDGSVDFAIQVDLSNFETGLYKYTMDTGRAQQWTQTVCLGSSFIQDGQLVCSQQELCAG